jgi:hypothetical protein
MVEKAGCVAKCPLFVIAKPRRGCGNPFSPIKPKRDPAKRLRFGKDFAEITGIGACADTRYFGE